MTEHTHHAIDYVELGATDLDAAKIFYESAFGWTFTDYGPTYAGFQRLGAPGEAGGITTQSPPSTDGPLVLLWSDDLDASVEAVRQAGGTVTDGPYEFPGGRRFHFHDPAGNELGVWSTT